VVRDTHADIYLVIHGHFYQPPRENPFLGAIESQPSAFPYHNWNERIFEECYKSNTASRVLDSRGRILDIVNNFEFLSFNIGPTLATWLEKTHPETYRKIIEADKISSAKNNGNGNAIAQVYNHVIMPLVSKRDKITQILWGKKDFERRFARKAEAIWLPETAINRETIEVLLEQETKFIILSPYQALRIRKIPDGKWIDVKDGSIDATRSYRVYLDGSSFTDKSLAVFFYQKDISKAVAFEHLLRNAGSLAFRIKEAIPKELKSPCLVNICTDGETYGHHEPFGDMCIAYLFKQEAKIHNFIITNYSNFLKIAPPEYEVELNFGEDGEGTSWSCFHGVKRWKEDCGCSIKKEPGWNQKWRAPLKKAMDLLSSELALVFEKEASKFVSDPWQARNDYGGVVVNNWSISSIELFFEKHLRDKNDRSSRLKLLKLLESQRYAMQMYTSCAWFFDDIEGIEAIQNLRFAAKAVELVKEFTPSGFILPFVNELENAVGNKSKKTGRSLFFLETNPYLDAMKKIVHQMVIEYIFFGNDNIKELYGYNLKTEEVTTYSQDQVRYFLGRIKANNLWLKEEFLYLFICIQKSELELKDYLIEVRGIKDFQNLKGMINEILKKPLDKIESQLLRLIKTSPLGIKDQLPDEKCKFLLKIAAQKESPLRKEITEFFENNKVLFDLLFESEISIPPIIKASLEYNFSANLLKETEEFLKDPDMNSPLKVKEVLEAARKFKLNLDLRKVTEKLSLTLEEKMVKLVKEVDLEKCLSIKSYLHILEDLSLKPSLTGSQNILFEFLQVKLPSMIELLFSQEKGVDEYELIVEILNLAEEINLNTDRFREQLKSFESKLIELPRFWP